MLPDKIGLPGSVQSMESVADPESSEPATWFSNCSLISDLSELS
jgi:hypothetical protein